MKQWIVEDWAFEITVAQAQPCRLDFEKGDRFNCKYECPAGFCPKTIPDSIPCAKLYAAAETTCSTAARSHMKLIFPVQMAASNFICLHDTSAWKRKTALSGGNS